MLTAVEVDAQLANWVKNVKLRMIAMIANAAPVSARVCTPTHFDDFTLNTINPISVMM